MLDCRQMLMGDRYRQLLRAYPEAIRRLSRKAPLPDRARDIEDSAEIRQYYDLAISDDRISLTLRDEAFTSQYPLCPDDFSLRIKRGAQRWVHPLPLERLPALGALLPLLAGDHDETEVSIALNEALEPEAREWANTFRTELQKHNAIERGPIRPNFFLRSPVRPRVSLVGHTSLLLQSARTTIVTDPISWPELGSPPEAFDVPRLALDSICITHAHWDHCNLDTLLLLDKRAQVIIPRASTATAFNPPIAPVLRRLGFQNLREVSPWETLQIGDVEMTVVPFFGEEDEPGAKVDHYTYVFRMPGLTLYGGVDGYRDSLGDMCEEFSRVRRDFQPSVAFLPISRMIYRYEHGSVNGFCRYVDTTLLDRDIQYTAGPEEAADWVERLGVSTVSPYATFSFARLAPPMHISAFAEALQRRKLNTALLPLRPLDSLDLSDLDGSAHAVKRRRRLLRRQSLGVLAAGLDKRLKRHAVYRVARRVLLHPTAQALGELAAR
jgi:L-ascorbate metabolism protein UlaG (beta-lactamase superfamily)